MPELPDVEGFRRYLARYAQGRRIERVQAPDPAIIRNRSVAGVSRALSGERFGLPWRHGKWLIAPAGDCGLLLHFEMTGFLRWSTDARDRHRHDRVIFVCEGGELRYNDMRRFGGVWLARDEAERDAVTGPLGPDAATLTREQLDQLLERRRGGIKAALMDQRWIAGIGNMLSDEILWRAGIDPSRPVSTLDARRRQRLYDALRGCVHESLRYGRIPRGERWLSRVRDLPGAACPRCGTTLRRGTVAGRTACWCPHDQL
jgi:formamidopyrimidine-DNA glycosylase